jgi:hypothetical protein
MAPRREWATSGPGGTGITRPKPRLAGAGVSRCLRARSERGLRPPPWAASLEARADSQAGRPGQAAVARAAATEDRARGPPFFAGRVQGIGPISMVQTDIVFSEVVYDKFESKFRINSTEFTKLIVLSILSFPEQNYEWIFFILTEFHRFFELMPLEKIELIKFMTEFKFAPVNLIFF